MEKIVALGFKASGTTSYLASMYHYMNHDVENFCLLPFNEEQEKSLTHTWEGICGGSFPIPVSETDRYQFSLRSSYGKVAEFEWVNIPGGALLDPGFSLIDEYKREILDAACVLIFVNGESFAYDGHPANKIPIHVENLEEYKRIVQWNLKRNKDLELLRQLVKIGSFEAMLPPIGIVLTKCDLIPDVWVSYIPDLIHESFWPLFEGAGNEQVVMLSGVSIGVWDRYGFILDPSGLEQPVFFGVLSILQKYVTSAQILQVRNSQTIAAADTAWKRMTMSGRLDQLKEENNRLKQLANTSSKMANHILSLFSSGKLIYINGEKQNFHQFYRNFFSYS